jgi:large subunit ribosomal protein L25
MAKHERIRSLTLQQRAETGSTRASALRHHGRIPGVLFGHGRPSVPIAVDARALAELLASGGSHHIVEATLDGARESVLLRELQRDPITRRPITADFQRVSQTEAISTAVAIVTHGVARGVKDFGGVMDVVLHELEIRGPAGQLPDQLDVDVTELGIGDHVTAADVKLPSGFSLVTGRDAIVVSIEAPRAAEVEAVEAEAPAEAPEAAAPAETPAET